MAVDKENKKGFVALVDQDEHRSLIKLADLAGWTMHGSLIYKDPLTVTVSQEWYFKISRAYADWYSRFERNRRKGEVSDNGS